MNRGVTGVIAVLSALAVLETMRSFAGAAYAAQADSGPGARPTVLVQNTAAGGEGSLAEAIRRANSARNGALVLFRIPRSDPGFDARCGTWTIRLAEPLPPITANGIDLDAPRSEKGRPQVVLAAAREGIEYALCLAGGSNRVCGLSIGGFKHGIVLYGPGSTHNRVEHNFVGLSPQETPTPNDIGIVLSDGASNNILDGNTISGNRSMGVCFASRGTAGNILRACRIGCDADGLRPVPNGMGVVLARASDTTIGGAGRGDGNVISGNSDIGILMVGKWTSGNRVLGNLIGVDATGSRLLHNDKGIVIKSLAHGNFIGGSEPGARNIISGNLQIGIYIEASDENVIAGNYIGTDATGTRAVVEGSLQQGNGVEFNTLAKNNVLGGMRPGQRNVISGHKVYGVVYYGHCERNRTLGNYIGTDAAGRSALPNATGICVDCASHHNDIAGNLISGNLNYGLFFVTRGTEHNTLRGNLIGTDAGGTTAIPNDIGLVISTGASENVVGGGRAEDRNVISGNRQSGIMITNRFTRANRVEGNYIGVDASGTRALGNKHGVILATFPEANVVTGNVISGNRTAGLIVSEHARDNLIIRNWIGTDVSGSRNLANAQAGVFVGNRAGPNTFALPGQENVIKFNPVGFHSVPQTQPATNAQQPATRPHLPAPKRFEPPSVTPMAIERSRKLFTVITAQDGGPGSLRQAIEQANRAGGPSAIVFRIPKSDPGYDPLSATWTIRYSDTPVPITATDLIIDGYSQHQEAATRNPTSPCIVLNGGKHSVEAAFVLLGAARVTIRGFVINEFVYGIQIWGNAARGNRIVGNYIGIDPTGSRSAPNYNGIEILSGAADNTIGGVDPQDRNVVSGNLHIGIRISDAHGNRIVGNFVGLDPGGTRSVPNYDGVCVEGRARANRIGGGGPGERNVISGNVAYGVDLFGAGVQENTVSGNFLGTDWTGTTAVPNTYGVLLDDRASRNTIGGTGPGEWNLISGNTAFGAYIYNNGTNSNVVRGNRIGTDVNGTTAIPNETGVHIDGGACANVVDQNVISGNLVAGITIFAPYTDRNLITRNLIGTTLNGRRPLPNGEVGVRIAFGPKDNVVGGSPETGNLIAPHQQSIDIDRELRASNRVSDNTGTVPGQNALR